jgi:ParB family chromosome partitioning protein
MAKISKPKMREIALDLIDEPSGVVRMDIDREELDHLADNIAEVGLIQPIMVRPQGDRFEVVAGHRRLLAHRLLEWNKIACVIHKVDDVQCALARASENLRRVDISPIEEAAVYADLRDNHGLTIPEIGKRMGKSGGIVKRRLDLLKMPPQLQKAVHRKEISYSVAEELWSLGDDSEIDYYLMFAIDHGATQAVVRGWVKDCKDAKRRKESGTGGGEGPAAPTESRPVYVTCDLCSGPMELGKETIIRSCPDCTKLISDAVKG